MKNMIVIYVTFPTNQEATNLIRALVQEKLIACGNVFQPHTSYYEWQGKLEETQEIAAILKTTPQLYDAAEAYILEHHTHECPCIVSFESDKGSSAFIDWVYGQLDETQAPSTLQDN